MGVKFYLFFNTLMNELIVSLPAEKLVFKIDISVSDSAAKIVPLAGNGQTCKGSFISETFYNIDHLNHN